ncbi:hypothetical protein AK812_SmicGene23020 [Symbiodinium microadriaticum]|uniref:Uncharacterized protein n=1 Tax=Symbiodinium microadriaticum TaxID=2951 RepID=A0A1Q9DI74_SYMMI|nr:hypothetical protein AK812_SmicGene23020 [Symbiodinium microadriaticum]
MVWAWTFDSSLGSLMSESFCLMGRWPRSLDLPPGGSCRLSRAPPSALSVPGFSFTVGFPVSYRDRSSCCVNRNNLSGEPNVVLPLSRFQGGGIWVAATGGRTPLNHRGATLEGEVLPVSQRAVAFDPHRVHATQAWKGTRIVLIGYTVRGCERLSEEQRAAASNLGFVLPPPEPAPAPAGAAFDSFPVVLEPVRPPKGAPCCARPSRARAYRVEPASFCSGSDEACQRYTFPPPRGFPGLPGFSRAEVRGLLLSMPPGRFVISSTFPDFDSALDSAPGWLDLFSGSRGFAKSLAASAPCWVLCLDISHGEDEDLLSENLQNLLLKLVSAKDQRDKVLAGNKMLEFSFELVQCAAAGSLTFWIENPQGSWFWKQPAWEEIKAEDAGWMGDFRPLDLARCAKCSAARIGEADNPGPRGPVKRRPPVQLKEVATVTKGTATLRAGIWSEFEAWVAEECGDEVWRTLEQQPDLLVEVLLSYGQRLYDRGRSLQEFRQLLAHCQHVVPRVKTILKPAWLLSDRGSWARRADLLTPKDLLQRDYRYYLLLREPKSRGRGARVQHVALDLEPGHAFFVEKVWGSLRSSEPLFPGSPGVYRRRWDKRLAALEIPSRFKLTPGCLRGGGAVAACRRKMPVADIQWTMRLQNQSTLAYYLQEVSAESVLPKLSAKARENVQAFFSSASSPAPLFTSALAASPFGLFSSCWPVSLDGVGNLLEQTLSQRGSVLYGRPQHHLELHLRRPQRLDESLRLVASSSACVLYESLLRYGALINEFILESYRFSDLGIAGTGTKQTLASQLCNPTDAPYKIHRLDVDARLQDESFLEGSLRDEVLVPPSSVAGMVLEYIVVRNWQPLVTAGLGVVINSAMGNIDSTHRATMQVSFIVRTVCTIRNTDVHLGVRANFPFLLAKLPEVWRWNETYYRDKYEMQSMLYEAVLEGAAQEAEQRQLRLLEWDSLDVGGELMIWVYGVVICCGAAFVISLFMLMLIALKSGISSRSCCRCRRLPATEPAQLQGVCATSVFGQRLEDICVEVAAEDLKPKPHLTKSFSQNLSPKQAALPVGQRQHTSS